MATTKLAIDGLWRCLCPSFDAAILAVPLTAPAPNVRRQRQRKQRNATHISKASIATTPTNRVAFGPQANPDRRIKAQFFGQRHNQQYDAVNDQPTEDHDVSRKSTNSSSSRGSGSETHKNVARGGSIQADVLLSERLLAKDGAAIEVGQEGSKARPTPTWAYQNLGDVPIPRLHLWLDRIQHAMGTFDKVMKLVNHLRNERGQGPTLRYYEALARANADAEHGSATMIATIMEEMDSYGIIANKEFYHACLQTLAVHPDYLLRARILQGLKDRWYGIMPEGHHHIIIGLLRERQHEMALDKLEQMYTENIKVEAWLHDIFIYVLCEAGELDSALEILQRRVDFGELDISPNIWYHMLDVCSKLYHYPGTLYVWQRRLSTCHIHPSDGMLTNILSLAARYNDSRLATDVVRVLTNRTAKLDVNHYECMLAAFAGDSDLETAFKLLSIMKRAQLEPTDGSTRPIYLSLIRSASYKPQAALKILQSLHDDGHLVPVASFNVIISAVLHQDTLEEAVEVYKGLYKLCPEGPNISTFNILLGGCSKVEDTQSNDTQDPGSASSEDSKPQFSRGKSIAMFLASEMVALKVKPNELTYDRLILVCLNEPDVTAPDAPDNGGGFTDAMLYLDEMRTLFSKPDSSRRLVAGSHQTRSDNHGSVPLRSGTWRALIQRAIDRGDERVWDLLNEAETPDRQFRKLRELAQDTWMARQKKIEQETSDEPAVQEGHDQRRLMPADDTPVFLSSRVNDGDEE